MTVMMPAATNSSPFDPVVQGDAIRQKRLGERGQHDRQDSQRRQQSNASAAHAVGGRGCVVDVRNAWFVSVGLVFRHARSLPR